MENTNNLTDKIGKEVSKEAFNLINNTTKTLLTVCGGMIAGYAIDIGLGGDGYKGAASGGAGGLLISEGKEYIEKLSRYLAKEIIKAYINIYTQYKNKKNVKC